MRTPVRKVVAVLAGAVLMAAGAGAGGAGAQSGPPPMIEFIQDNIVSPTVLDVIAGITPGGAAVTAFVRYGTTTSYGLTSAHKNIGPGSRPVMSSWQLTGLHRSTTYHFQIVAVSASGRTVSADSMVPMPATSLTRPVGPPPTPPSVPAGNADEVRAVAVPTADFSFSDLNDISCPTTTFCLTVGEAGTSITHWRPLTERFDGRAFAVLASPSAWGAQLLGIACRTARFCLAVGSDGNYTSSERWNGTGWSVLPTPSPRLDGGDMLTKVACVSTSDCFSIGVENGGTKDAVPLVEHWNGSAWSIVPTPAASSVDLESISCPSATSCFIVGIKDAASGLGRPLIEHWDGRAFALSPVPLMSGQLFSVSCGGPESCVAVGNQGGGRALLLDLAGGSWHTSPAPRLGGFSATACVSTSSCLAVGSLTAHWNGRAWALGHPAPTYGGAQEVELAGLSCPAPTDCVAVGELVHPPKGPGLLATGRAIGDMITVNAAAHG